MRAFYSIWKARRKCFTLSKGANHYAKRIVRKDEHIRLIMECRQSGLSDYQWCQRQDINIGTFYNWVSKLRKPGYTFPDSKSKSEGAVVVQDVVKVNLVSEDMPSSVIEQNTRTLAVASTPSLAAKMVVGNVCNPGNTAHSRLDPAATI